MQLTQKERLYLQDAAEHEKLCIAKYNDYSSQVSCPQLASLLQQIAQSEQQHLQTIQQVMQGQMPNLASSGSQSMGQGGQSMGMSGGQGQGGVSMQAGGQMGANKPTMSTAGTGQMQQGLSDKEICQDLITTEKAIAGMYNTATFEASNHQLRQVLSHIQQEEQDHAFQIFNYMQQKGWYQPQ
ncbi:MAG: spore coat protein [Firmicutes bacterium]|nr:spore coat protein [Bacillota bacterium]